MALRIYAFAKELGLDNKQLLDICEQAGVKGKGSALANLEDHEVDIIKNFISSKDSSATSKASPAAGPALVEPRRDDIIPSRAAPLRDLTAPKSRKKETTFEPQEADDEVALSTDFVSETVAETTRSPLSRLKGDRSTTSPPPETTDSEPQSPTVESPTPDRMAPERATPLRPLQNIQRAKDPSKSAPLAGKKIARRNRISTSHQLPQCPTSSNLR